MCIELRERQALLPGQVPYCAAGLPASHHQLSGEGQGESSEQKQLISGIGK